MTKESMKKEIDNFISSVIDGGEGKDIVKPLIFSICYSNDEERQYVACGFVPSNESVTALAVTAASIVTPVSSGDDIVHSLRFMEVDLSSPDNFWIQPLIQCCMCTKVLHSKLNINVYK